MNIPPFTHFIVTGHLSSFKVLSFWLLQRVLKCHSYEVILRAHLHAFLLCVYLGVECCVIAWVCLFSFSRYCHCIFQSICTIFHSHWQHMGVLWQTRILSDTWYCQPENLQLQLHTALWLNLINMQLSEKKARQKRKHAIWFHLYKTPHRQK